MIHMSVKEMEIPAITIEQMREVDRLMVEKYGIKLIQMMETAGRSLAELTREMLGGSVMGKQVVVAAGGGNNGGGGLVSARHLHNWGADVTVLLQKEELHGVPEIQWGILKQLLMKKKSGVEAIELVARCQCDLVVDALIGYGISGSPRGWTCDIIEQINKRGVPIIALDVPSGMDATTGEVHNPCVKARATMTLALPKTGLINSDAKGFVGRLYLADIGVPDELYKELGVALKHVFHKSTIIDLDSSKRGYGS